MLVGSWAVLRSTAKARSCSSSARSKSSRDMPRGRQGAAQLGDGHQPAVAAAPVDLADGAAQLAQEAAVAVDRLVGLDRGDAGAQLLQPVGDAQDLAVEHVGGDARRVAADHLLGAATPLGGQLEPGRPLAGGGHLPHQPQRPQPIDRQGGPRVLRFAARHGGPGVQELPENLLFRGTERRRRGHPGPLNRPTAGLHEAGTVGTWRRAACSPPDPRCRCDRA